MFLLTFIPCFLDYICADALCSIFIKRKDIGAAKRWGVIFLAAVALSLFNLLRLLPLNPFVAALFVFILERLLFEGSFPIQAGLAIFAIAISGSLEFVGVQLLLLFGQASIETVLRHPSDAMFMALAILSKLFYFLLIRILYMLFSKETYQNADIKSVSLLLLPIVSQPLSYTVLVFQQQMTFTPANQALGSSIYILLVIANLVVFWVFDAQLSSIALGAQLASAQAERAEKEAYYKMQEQHLHELRCLSHDFKNQLITAQGMASQQNAALQGYLRHLTGEVSAHSSSVREYSDNRAVNIVLYEKGRECREAGILLQIAAEPFSLAFVAYADACSLLGNALDNAICACKQIADPQSRRIQLSFASCNQVICITIENSRSPSSFIKQRQGKLVSTKKNARAHGYGLYNMKAAAERYDGRVLLSYTDTCFQVVIFLQKQGEGSREDEAV